jgi:RNA polymerase sigma-70 factor (ECF subfamily)
LSSIQTVQEARSGSREAFICLIHENEQMMYAIAKGFFKSDEDAADAIQETILKAYKGITKLREPAYFRTWLIRILINECRQLIRQNSKVIPLKHIVERADPSNRIEAASQLELYDFLSGLDFEHKEVVMLYYLEDFPVKDIAQTLGISESAVKSRLHRARAKLAVLFKETEGEAEQQ